MELADLVVINYAQLRSLEKTLTAAPWHAVILDEGQNTTTTQMLMFLTRMGEGSRIVVTGDTTQTDLPPSMQSGLVDAILRLRSIQGIGVVELTGADIVRHRLVREIVEAYDDDSSKSPRRKH